jgi:survival-of-motor-neuron-related-splicing factor 30
MSAEEIESYKFQLEQVELALRSDPENEELTKLQSDLKELINMFEAANSLSSAAAAVEEEKKPIKKQQPADVTKLVPAATSTALKSREFAVDQEVMARWSGDGEYYKAVITAIGGTDQVFSVKFKGYSESEFVKAEDIKPVADKKRTGIFEVVEGSSEPKQKKKKDASTGEPTTKKKKTVEFENKKNAWLNFATGGNKKKKSATSAATSAINKKSIFKTPDNPEGKGKRGEMNL